MQILKPEIKDIHRSLYNIPSLVITQDMMRNTARSCINVMEVLSGEQKRDVSWSVPFHILATTAIELFPKIVLSQQRKEGECVLSIKKDFQEKYGHNLKKLYNESILGKDFLLKSHIIDVKEVKDEKRYIYQYDFYTIDSDIPVHVYDLESLRYGLMSQKPNLHFVDHQFGQILGLCRHIQNASLENL